MLLSKENITLVNLITLQQAFGAGSIKAVKLFNFMRERNILDNPLSKDTIKNLLQPKDAEKLLSFDTQKIYKIIDDCIKNEIAIITICDANYPERLRNINDCPIVLYIKGEL